MAVLVIAGVLLSSVIPTCIDRINRAKYEKMINEMTSIAQASIDYYNSQYHDPSQPNASWWPSDLSQLAPKYLFQTITTNPWGERYSLSFPNNSLTMKTTNLVVVSSIIPSGIAQKNPEGPMVNVNNIIGTNTDQISIGLSVPNEGIGMVQYEKKYLYNQ
jgi:type II secretory pathway pseudopilin PulG